MPPKRHRQHRLGFTLQARSIESLVKVFTRGTENDHNCRCFDGSDCIRHCVGNLHHSREENRSDRPAGIDIRCHSIRRSCHGHSGRSVISADYNSVRVAHRLSRYRDHPGSPGLWQSGWRCRNRHNPRSRDYDCTDRSGSDHHRGHAGNPDRVDPDDPDRDPRAAAPGRRRWTLIQFPL